MSNGNPRHPSWRHSLRPTQKHGRTEANSYRLLLAQIGCQMCQRIRRAQSGRIPSPETGGVGVAEGCEAAAHAARRYLDNLEDDNILVKLDFSNAFNTLFREKMLQALHKVLPEIAVFCSLAYSEPSHLKHGVFSLLSQVGPQQGDPLDPLLFCLPLKPILVEMASPLTLGYLDDVTLGGKTQVVADDIAKLEAQCKILGLLLNRPKCEVISRSPIITQDTHQLHASIHMSQPRP